MVIEDHDMQKWGKIATLFFLSGVLLTACFKEPEYPDKPSIQFEEFQAESDSVAKLVISFTDGDGNIGLAEGDTVGSFASSSKYYHNLFLEYYERQGNKWVKRELNPPFYYRIPPLTEGDKEEPLEGDIHVTIEPLWYDPTSSYDTIKYSIQVVDRDLNESNVVETRPIALPD